jgi:hypothetical protein
MMVSEKTIQWLDRVVWLFIYGGLLVVTLGVFSFTAACWS